MEQNMDVIKKSWISDKELNEMFSSSYWNDEEAEKKKMYFHRSHRV